MNNEHPKPRSGEPVEIFDYNPEWPALFARERELIYTALEEFALDIQHMGSTSVPNLAAKPIIDILVGVQTLELPPEHVSALGSIGYEYRGQLAANIPEDLYFPKGSPRSHQIHMTVLGGEFWDTHLLFRDYLRANPKTVKEYEILKRRLTAQYPTGRLAYTDAKTDFITGVLATAREWRKTN